MGVDIYEFLKERSTFEDTLSSVLRRELGLPDPGLTDSDDAAMDRPIVAVVLSPMANPR